MMCKNKIWVYCRVVRRDDMAITAQKKRLEEYAAAHHLLVQKIFEDQGSGLDNYRPGLIALTAVVNSGNATAVLMWSVDRLYRSRCELIQYLMFLEKHRVRLLTVREGLIMQFDHSLADDILWSKMNTDCSVFCFNGTL